MENRYLYLVRHGQYFMDKSTGDKFLHLTELGLNQARATAAYLKQELPDAHCIYSSTMIRACETAEIIAEAFKCDAKFIRSKSLCECFPALTERILTEADFGLGLPFYEVRKQLLVDPSYRNDLEVRFEEKYGWRPASTAAEKAFKRFFIRSRYQEKHDILVCHGNIIRFFVAKAINCLPELWANMATHNCAVTVIRINRKGKVILEKYNDNSHITKPERTMT